MSKEGKIAALASIVLTGFAAAVFYHYVMGVYLGLGFPRNTFLFIPADRWMDFLWHIRGAPSPYLEPRAYFPHFPLVYLIANVQVAIGGIATSPILFLLLAACFFAFTCYQNVRGAAGSVPYAYWFTLTFLSYPFLISMDRANLELLLFAVLYLFLVWASGWRYRWALLGIAIALKPVAGVFVVVQLYERRFKDALWSLIIGGGLDLAGYAVLPGGLVQNLQNHLRNLDLYTKVDVIGNEGLAFGNSLFGAMKFMVLLARPFKKIASFAQAAMLPYTIATLVVFAGIALYIFFVERSRWKVVALLVCSMNLLPFVSGDYHLIQLFLPVFLFINAPSAEKLDRVYLVILGLLLIPKNYFGLPALPMANIGVVLNPMLMVLLCMVIIYQGIRDLRSRPAEAVSKPAGAPSGTGLPEANLGAG